MSATRTTAQSGTNGPIRNHLRSVQTRDRDAWVSKALCRTGDPDELFVRGAAQRRAATICRHCPVVLECGADALQNRVEWGVWGGMTERQRRALLRQHSDVVSWVDFLAAARRQRRTAI
ncbi:transcriptional regulator [Mycobacterium sp. 852002-51613_SCH5001154]|uniref:WhiB family transcriptional regulator n=1 Tax=unclassified Mycobacterium TaxID=2642494 RepID=UPI0008012843|nr:MULTISPECIES: WhiB family transcriptional regulator [unclassified Mycobacterium]OBF74783.1 transcriptional regulator [Mycobacterium sp. 852002-51613_SCH5001154]OBF96808.1 transcriptional regulator [Mycobacterium sp. 852014-52450_SCH5900713]